MQPISKKWAIPFLTMWTGQALSLLGSSVAQFALVWWVTKLTGSATVLATATIMAVLPGVLLGPIAGAYVDRASRKRVMIAADGVVALAALWLAFLFWSGAIQVWHVYVAMFIRAVGGSFHWPAMQASTSLMVPKEHLSRVAGLNQAMYGLMSIAGPPLGALLMAVLPLHAIMLVDVGTALLAIVLLLFVSVPQPLRAAGVDAAGSKPSIWADVVQGLRYVAGWPGLLMLLIAAMIINLVISPASSLMPLGLAVAGPLSDSLGIRVWYIIGGLACIVIGAIGFLIPAIVNIEQNHREPEVAVSSGVLVPVEVAADDVDVLE